AVSTPVYRLMLAGAALSIVLAPPLHTAAEPAVAILVGRRKKSSLSCFPENVSAEDSLRRHASLCGYGRVGSVVGAALRRRGFPLVVIEQDQRTVERLRWEGVPALLGYADQQNLLDRVQLERARVLVVAIPDALATRLVVDYAQR